ncbi:18 kDa heat shock protein [Maioricimonas rarisocia]|uniref:18 kDa heat shock protein n=1 Tax=Maioricimonas rarisocia TaxID=2528026 RepID=A0A517Z726_9PLAN|nr:Hsp20/alpha crystallin family protein [Maioricimonas rarisocia]QDU38231.1 18 kDa heat shock protein [Maioricimonas rarisocia]
MNSSLSPFRFRGGLPNDFRREIDDVMNRFFDLRDEGSGETLSWTPRVNLAESDDHYEVSADLPGMKPDDIDIEIRHGDLWITGTRHGESEQKEQTWHRIERFHGQFRRVVRLGDDVDTENVSAEYEDGVLRITVPKAEDARTKRIEVKCRS